jgi:hypothetical protein
MDDLYCTVTPVAVRRRILLNMTGFRLRDGLWRAPSGGQILTEEAVDAMSDLAFCCLLAPWLGSACASALN